MRRKAVSGIMLRLFFVGMLTLPLSVQLVGASEVHDVAVTAVQTFKTVCGNTFPIHIVFERRSLNINATVENQGDFDETFNVTAKYNGNTIQTMLDVNLTAHTSTNVTFMWDTTDVAKGNYIISVEASAVQGETDTTDNTLTDGTVTVTRLGDMDGDCDIDEDDLWYFCPAFIIYYSIWPPPLVPRCDLDEDCDIDEDDLWIFCAAFIDYYKAK